jgi:hypothetical protein
LPWQISCKFDGIVLTPSQWDWEELLNFYEKLFLPLCFCAICAILFLSESQPKEEKE